MFLSFFDYEIPVIISLAFILAVLAVTVVASRYAQKGKADAA